MRRVSIEEMYVYVRGDEENKEEVEDEVDQVVKQKEKKYI